MSHNVTSLNAQEPNRAGVVPQALEDLSDVPTLSASDGQALGWSAGPTLAPVNLPDSYDVAGSIYTSGSGWAGTHTYTVGGYYLFRYPSMSVNVDASKMSFVSGTWISQFTLAAGDYLMKWDLPMSPSASSAWAVLRLRDITNSQYVGPKIKVGDGRSSNHAMVFVQPTASTTYAWEFLQINGGITLVTATTLRGFQGAVLEEL